MTTKMIIEAVDFARYCIEEERYFQSFWDTYHSDYPKADKEELKMIFDDEYNNQSWRK